MARSPLSPARAVASIVGSRSTPSGGSTPSTMPATSGIRVIQRMTDEHGTPSSICTSRPRSGYCEPPSRLSPQAKQAVEEGVPIPCRKVVNISSVEAHLTIVFTASAVAPTAQDRTGESIRAIVRQLRVLRSATITINGAEQTFDPRTSRPTSRRCWGRCGADVTHQPK
jgi:hypothetical protein